MRPLRQVAKRRRGSVLIVALVCLVIVVSMIGGMLLTALTAQRQLRAERDLRQCELLLDAGVDRARHRESGGANYRGETWNLPGEEIVGAGAGVVMIEALPDSPRQYRVSAEYPAGGETSIRRSRVIQLSTNKSNSKE